MLQCLYYLTINTGKKFLNMIYSHTVGICISALVGVGIHQVVAGGWWLVVNECLLTTGDCGKLLVMTAVLKRVSFSLHTTL